MSALVLSVALVNLCDYPVSFFSLLNLPIATDMPPDSRSVATFTHLSRFSKVRLTSRISQGETRKCICVKINAVIERENNVRSSRGLDSHARSRAV